MLFGNVIYYGSKLTTRSETSVHLWPGLKIFSLSPNVGSNPVMFFKEYLFLFSFVIIILFLVISTIVSVLAMQNNKHYTVIWCD